MRPTMSRRRLYIATAAVVLLGGTFTIDQLQRSPGGVALEPSTQQWQLADTAFALEPHSLQLLPGTPAPLLTGSFSRAPDAPEDSLPSGALLELLLPEWRERSIQNTVNGMPRVPGNSLQDRLLQEALDSAVKSAATNAEPSKHPTHTPEQAQALQWLSFHERQFITPLPEHGDLQLTASLGKEPLNVRTAGDASQLLLGTGLRGSYTWTQPSLVSSDNGLHWHYDAQRQQPSAIDQQGWSRADTGFVWHTLDQALLVSQDRGTTWIPPQVHTPMPSGPTLPPVDPALPRMLQEWHQSQALPAFAPSIWSDLPAQELQEVRAEFLFHTLPTGEVHAWSTRWTRALDADGAPSENWQAALTRRFVLEMDAHSPSVTVRDIETEHGLLPIRSSLDGTRMPSPDGSLTWLRDGQLQYFNPQTRRWQAPVPVPQPMLQRLGAQHRAWAGNSIWITQSLAPALGDIAVCLLPKSLGAHARCKAEHARTYAFSRDQGGSWQQFQLPDAMRSHIVGWDERAQQLLVAIDADATQPVRLQGYRLP